MVHNVLNKSIFDGGKEVFETCLFIFYIFIFVMIIMTISILVTNDQPNTFVITGILLLGTYILQIMFH